MAKSNRVIAREARRWNDPRSAFHGTYKSGRLLAVELVEEEVVKIRWAARKAPHPATATAVGQVSRFAQHAFTEAVHLAMLSRGGANAGDVGQFVMKTLLLREYLDRYTNHPEKQTIMKAWPLKPEGVEFHRNLEYFSALEVAVHFARIIERVTCFTCTGWGGNAWDVKEKMDESRVNPEPDPRFEKWRQRFIEELLTHTLLPVAVWPTWDMRRDRDGLVNKMQYEYIQTHDALQAASMPPPAIAGEFAPASWFRDQFGITAGALRKQAERGNLRMKKQGRWNHYAVADARTIWPKETQET